MKKWLLILLATYSFADTNSTDKNISKQILHPIPHYVPPFQKQRLVAPRIRVQPLSYRKPLLGLPRPIPNFSSRGETYNFTSENSFKTVSTDPLSTFSIDVDTASYSNTRRFLRRDTLPPKDSIRIEEMVNYFDYDYRNSTDTLKVFSEVGVAPWKPENLLLKIGIKGKELETLPDNNLVFLIDVSGSMSSKMRIVKNSLKILTRNLKSRDRVSIVTYASTTAVLLKATSDKEKIVEAIDSILAWGSTFGEGGIELAYSEAEKSKIDGNNRIVLITDGDFNVGLGTVSEMENLIEKKRESGIFLTVAGVGMGNYRDDMVETLADKGNGNYFYIDSILEAKKIFSEDLVSNLHTVAKDTKIQVEFNPKYVAEYRLIGYENRKLENRDFKDDKKDAGEIGVGDEVTAFYEIVPSDGNFSSSLKYQNISLKDSKELLTLKVRYKEVEENSSKEIVHTVQNSKDVVSQDFQFASAVISFGMLLKESKFSGNLSYEKVLEIAKESKGEDNDGLRAEFIKLVETAKLLQ
jgi:Ca-activated chloride channel family protein